MATVNDHAIDTIVEEAVVEETREVPKATPGAIAHTPAANDTDKYESATDPVLLRTGRARAKANHTRSLRAVSTAVSSNDLNVTAGELESLRESLVRNYDIVKARHNRLLAYMPNADASELEDENLWMQRIELDHQDALRSVDDTLAALQAHATSPTETQSVTAVRPKTIQARPVLNAQHTASKPESRASQSRAPFRWLDEYSTSSSVGTPTGQSLKDRQSASFQGFFRQVRGFASRTLDALTPRRDTQTTRSRLLGQSFGYPQTRHSLPPISKPPRVQAIDTRIGADRVEDPSYRRGLEDLLNRIEAADIGPQNPHRMEPTVSRPASQARQEPVDPPFAPPVSNSPATQPSVVRGRVLTHPPTPSAPISQQFPSPLHESPEIGRVNASYSPDSWIFEPEQYGGTSFLKPPKLELMKFDGNPLNWPLFIQTFKVQVHDAVRSDAERIAHLGNCLPDHVRSQLGQLIIQPGLYRYALAELQRLYGSRRVIIKSCSSVLDSLKPFNNNDYQGLAKLSSSLRAVVATMQLCGFEAELSSYSNVELVLRKLSPSLQERWASAVWNLPELPTLVDLSDFISEINMIEYTRRLGVTGSSERPTQPVGRHGKSTKSQSQVSSFAVTTSSPCDVCKNAHALSDCAKFKAMNPEQRCDVIREKNLCLRCLKTGHVAKDCKTARKCGKEGCDRLHHPLIHGAPRIYPPKSASAANNPSASSYYAGALKRHQCHGTMLPIVPVRLEYRGRSVNTFAFLDQGSELTLVNSKIAKELFLDGPATTMNIETVNGHAQKEFRKLPPFIIASRDDRSRFDLVDSYATEHLQIAIKSKSPKRMQEAWPHLKDLAFESPDPKHIGILVGGDHPAVIEILEYRKDPANPRAPRGLLTHFGWCVAGPSATVGARSASCYLIRVLEEQAEDDSFNRDFRRFVGLDEFGLDAISRPPVPPAVARATRVFADTIRLVKGHYEVGLPWADDEPLPDNRDAAMRWFLSQETRIMRNPELTEKCRKVMCENVDLGFARKLSEEEDRNGTPGRTWYNKYHPVINPNKPAKCRMVFDLSALFHGVSLNSKLLKGPDLIANQVGVTLRFRRYEYAIVADIEKMFYQVLVRPEDASVFRYLWREPGSQELPAAYEMNVHLFGATSSPAVCCYALQQAARDSGPHASELLDEVVSNFYVDNWLSSFEDKDEGVRTAKLLIDALSRGGFNLTQFAASHLEILEKLDKRSGIVPVVDMSLDAESIERTLGLVWNWRRDVFRLSVKDDIPLHVKTKRELLSVSSKIYDPIGFLAAVKLVPKLLFQETCRRKLNWDDPLSEEIIAVWHKWAKSLPALKRLEIPRCLRPPDMIDSRTELHVFADASEYAHGAVAYLRYVMSDRAECSFVMAKSNLAPLRPSTIPRNELNGALSAARLSRTLVNELDMRIVRVAYWTDSTTVIRWLRMPTARFTAYVGARIGEILEFTDPTQWFYVPTAVNPADDASRGISPKDLNENHRWFKGPDFLKLVPDQWPPAPLDAVTAHVENDPEVRSTMDIYSTTVAAGQVSLLVDSSSNLEYIVRVIAYVIRWVDSVKVKPSTRPKGMLSVAETQRALKCLVRHEQLVVYRREIDCLRAGRSLPSNSHLLSLRPFLDSEGVLRVGGRFSKSSFPPDVRQPILLPRTSRVTRLIVLDAHRPQGCLKDHLSKEATLHEIRRRFWIPCGRQTVGRIVNDCLRCRIKKGTTVAPVMADLPTGRLQHGVPAFTHTGVDYFGPFEVLILRRRVKRWLALFVCFATRAVHIEVVYSMSTDSFLACLWRFEARRGVPAHYYSDNGTYFVGAVNELSECIRNLDQEKIERSLARRGVVWHFNPPGAPHFGGVWERLVGSAKRAYGSVLTGQHLTDEVLLTATAQVESLLNSRPLTYLCDDPVEPEPLTPNHLLLGRANPSLPPDVFTDADLSAKKYWRRAQAIASQFWRRWMREYLPPLNVRRKWKTDQRDLSVGDVVALLDSDHPRGTWKLARVMQVFPGDDGVVRSAEVRISITKDEGKRTVTTSLRRPVHKMVLLIPADEHLCPQTGPGPAVCAKSENSDITESRDSATLPKISWTGERAERDTVETESEPNRNRL